MIINLLFNAVIAIIGIFFTLLPEATLESLPYVGDTIDSTLNSMMWYWNTIIDNIPYLQYSYNVFLWVIIPFELSILIFKVFAGQRTPIAEA